MTRARLADFFPLALRAILAPRVSLRRVLDLNLDRNTLHLAAFLVITLQLIAGTAMEFLIPALPEGDRPASIPFGVGVALQVTILFGGAFLLYFGGRLFNGAGDYTACLTTAIWISFVIFVVQLALPVGLLISAQAYGLVALLCITIGLIQIVGQTMEVHQFENVFVVILCVFVAQLLLGFALLTLLMLSGVDIPLEPA